MDRPNTKTCSHRLASRPNTDYTLEFFASDDCDPSGNGEGEAPSSADEVAVEEAAHEGEEHELHIHMPTPSYYPLLASIGLPVICYGLMYKAWPVALIGGLVTLGSVYGWALEPATEPEPPEPPVSPGPPPSSPPERESSQTGAEADENGNDTG